MSKGIATFRPDTAGYAGGEKFKEEGENYLICRLILGQGVLLLCLTGVFFCCFLYEADIIIQDAYLHHIRRI